MKLSGLFCLLLSCTLWAESSKTADFILLFNGTDLKGWVGQTEGYQAQDGVLTALPRKSKGAKIYTAKEYTNFIFQFEFKLTPGANNGIGIRAPLTGNPAKNAMEIQVLDDSAPRYAKLNPTQYHGSIYKRAAAKRGHLKPVGEWNRQEIRAEGNFITVILNDVTILDRADITRHKRPTKGHIALLGHGSQVEFRNLRIREIPKTE